MPWWIKKCQIRYAFDTHTHAHTHTRTVAHNVQESQHYFLSHASVASPLTFSWPPFPPCVGVPCHGRGSRTCGDGGESVGVAFCLPPRPCTCTVTGWHARLQDTAQDPPVVTLHTHAYSACCPLPLPFPLCHPLPKTQFHPTSCNTPAAPYAHKDQHIH